MEKLTVLVFRDTDLAQVGFEEGDVFFDHRVDTRDGDVTGLNLLDVSDFYGMFRMLDLYCEVGTWFFGFDTDVAEDEFGCFDKSRFWYFKSQYYIACTFTIF